MSELADAIAPRVMRDDRHSYATYGPRVLNESWAQPLDAIEMQFGRVVPIVFTETRPLAQEWAHRFLGAALAHHDDDDGASQLVADLPPAGAVPPPAPTTAEVRAWAREEGLTVLDRGRLHPDVWVADRGPEPTRPLGWPCGTLRSADRRSPTPPDRFESRAPFAATGPG